MEGLNASVGVPATEKPVSNISDPDDEELDLGNKIPHHRARRVLSETYLNNQQTTRIM
jgi:hypothetical protein